MKVKVGHAAHLLSGAYFSTFWCESQEGIGRDIFPLNFARGVL